MNPTIRAAYRDKNLDLLNKALVAMTAVESVGMTEPEFKLATEIRVKIRELKARSEKP